MLILLTLPNMLYCVCFRYEPCDVTRDVVYNECCAAHHGRSETVKLCSITVCSLSACVTSDMIDQLFCLFVAIQCRKLLAVWIGLNATMFMFSVSTCSLSLYI